MNQMPGKSALLLGVVVAVCAFVVPSVASASSWTGLGTHKLFSPNLSFGTPIAGFNITWSCTGSEFDADVVNGAVIEITSATFQDCRGTPDARGFAATCTATTVGTKFPWTATATATDDIQIHGIHLDVWFEDQPGSVFPCNGNIRTTNLTVTGTVTGASWNTTSREVTFDTEPGLTSTGVIGASAVSVTGTLRDTTGTLGVIM